MTAPKHLKPATREWYESVCSGYHLEEHHARLLQSAAEAWDRTQQAREALAANGLIYTDRFDQPRSRPEIGIERDSRLAFARLLRELALDVEAPASDESRPPVIVGRVG